jgi:hypothetical protein
VIAMIEQRIDTDRACGAPFLSFALGTSLAAPLWLLIASLVWSVVR